MKYAVIIALIILIVVVIVYRKRIFTMILGPQQEMYIKELNPKVQNRVRQFVKRVENETDYNIIFTDGYRTFEQQETQHEIDPRNPAPGDEFHNYGLAWDINASNGMIYLRKSSSRQEWLNSGIPQIAESMGIRWGGNFSNYYDPVHFDFGNDYNIAQLKQLAYSQFGTNWNNIQGNKINLA